MAEHSIKNTLETVAEYIGEEVKDALDGKEDIFRVDTMPVASGENVGQIIQYTGATNANYTNGFFYKCVASEEGGTVTYSWQNIPVQDVTNKEDKFRVTTLPIASAGLVGQSYQYIGTTTLTLIHNYYYECRQVPESDPAEYEWVASEVQASAGISQQDLATAQDVQDIKDVIDLIYGFDILANDNDVQAVKDIVDQINDFIPYYD